MWTLFKMLSDTTIQCQNITTKLGSIQQSSKWSHSHSQPSVAAMNHWEQWNLLIPLNSLIVYLISKSCPLLKLHYVWEGNPLSWKNAVHIRINGMLCIVRDIKELNVFSVICIHCHHQLPSLLYPLYIVMMRKSDLQIVLQGEHRFRRWRFANQDNQRNSVSITLRLVFWWTLLLLITTFVFLLKENSRGSILSVSKVM